MGCGAMCAAKEATDEQKEEMCKWACKTACVVTLQHALDSFKNGSVTIVAPLDKPRAFSADIRKEADDLEESGKKAGEDAKSSLSKMAPSFMKGAAEAVGSVAGKAADATASGVASGLRSIADSLDAKIKEQDTEFKKVATELCNSKQDQMKAKYNELFEKVVFHSSLKLVRMPETKDQITRTFMESDVGGKLLSAHLSPVVKEFIDESATVKAYNDFAKGVEDFNKKVKDLTGKEEMLGKMEDIEAYIVQQVVDQFAILMATKEKEVRDAPQGKAKTRMETFELCFSDKVIMDFNFKAYQEGK